MMRQISNALLFFCLLVPAGIVCAQDTGSKPVTVHLTHVGVAGILKEVEKQAGYRFYYDTADLDTTKIDINVDGVPFGKVLDQVFAGTDISYSIDRHQHVFITRGEAIHTELPPGYFDRISGGQGGFAGGDSVRDYLAETGNQPVATLENKLYTIGDKNSPGPRNIANVAGYARDAKTGEPIIGASIYIDNPRIGVSSDQYGYYNLSLPKGRHILNIQSIGMRDTRRLIMVYGDGKLNIDLQTQVITLKKVIVSAEKASNVRRTEMGVQKLDIKTIKQVPVVFGETDVLRVITTLPGVKTVGEASTGLNVRGGAADVLLN